MLNVGALFYYCYSCGVCWWSEECEILAYGCVCANTLLLPLLLLLFMKLIEGDCWFWLAPMSILPYWCYCCWLILLLFACSTTMWLFYGVVILSTAWVLFVFDFLLVLLTLLLLLLLSWLFCYCYCCWQRRCVGPKLIEAAWTKRFGWSWRVDELIECELVKSCDNTLAVMVLLAVISVVVLVIVLV